MATPVIDSVTPPTASLSPGQFVDVDVVAHDPDSASGNVTFPVADSQGNTTPATIVLTLDDPLTFGEALNPDGLAVTVAKIASSPTQATYRVTAT
jgi:methionine-rich copper-binding protein CopC